MKTLVLTIASTGPLWPVPELPLEKKRLMLALHLLLTTRLVAAGQQFDVMLGLARVRILKWCRGRGLLSGWHRHNACQSIAFRALITGRLLIAQEMHESSSDLFRSLLVPAVPCEFIPGSL